MLQRAWREPKATGYRCGVPAAARSRSCHRSAQPSAGKICSLRRWFDAKAAIKAGSWCLHALKCVQKVNGRLFKRGRLGRRPDKAEVRPIDPVEGVVSGDQARHRGRGGEARPEANGFYVRHAGREQDTAVGGGSKPQQVDFIEVPLPGAVPAAAERYAAEEAHVVFQAQPVDGVHDLSGVVGVLVQAAEDEQVRDGQAAAASLTAHHRQGFDREVNAFDVEDADRVEQDRPAGIELTTGA